VPLSIPDNNAAGISSTIRLNGSGVITSLRMSLDIQHTWRGDLVVKLTSPGGTQHTVLARNSGDSADNVLVDSEAIATFNGQSASGEWTLSVSDNAGLAMPTAAVRPAGGPPRRRPT
jgi:subtilisin-like proprotein convertase family protein